MSDNDRRLPDFESMKRGYARSLDCAHPLDVPGRSEANPLPGTVIEIAALSIFHALQ